MSFVPKVLELWDFEGCSDNIDEMSLALETLGCPKDCIITH
jgi:hypothetical protein